MGLFDEISREWDSLWKPKNTNQFTGSVGGSVYSETPGIGKYNTGGDNFTQGIGDWFKNIKMPWDNTPSQPSQTNLWTPSNTSPWEDTGGWSSLGEHPSYWEKSPFAGATAGAITPLGMNEGQPIPEYKQLTPQNINEFFDKAGAVDPTTKEPLINENDLRQYLDQAARIANDDKTIRNVVDVAWMRKVQLPQIGSERLSQLTDTTTIKTLWDLGYKVPQVIEPLATQIQNLSAQYGNLVDIDTSKLNQLGYNNIQGLMQELDEIVSDPDEWQRLIDNNTKWTLDYNYSDIDEFGNPRYTAKWVEKDQMYKTKAEKEAEAKAKQKSEQAEREAEEIAKYWSPEAVAERNRRRQENENYATAKAMEGWTEFYDTFNRIKLPPLMDEYFNRPEMFNELRRQWRVKGGDWQAFLNNYDFKGEFNKQSPYRRGERPGQFAPVMRSRS